MSQTSQGNRGGYGRQQSNNNGQQSRTPPVHELRAGKIKVAVWENLGEKGQAPWFSVTCSRAYIDSQKKWHTATSFGRDDLLQLGLLLQQAYLWITNAAHGGDGNGDDPGMGNER